ncbi:hypothetical protein [Allorhodopirellula heiligendammensis]|uniref:DUF1549 domain-containing protein n=1 Tax=Allorhodopirellula heiligendammensis TaxID=2714739 RepID=A0A5C6C4F9_9BACT|nr:hypothetical protein [Allorhodopirellula heiligendammensis]TWU19068.1 hypothetical protein Poly21_12390 [Allorhodopirellula heiligendammensis]
MTPPEKNDPLSSGDDAGGFDTADAMLDALLAEVLAGQTPPDQSDVIIRRLQQPIINNTAAARKPVNRPSRASNSRANNSPRKQSSSTWKFTLVTAAGLLLCVGVAVGIRYQRDIAVAQNSDPSGDSPTDKSADSQTSPRAGESAAQRNTGDGKANTPAPREHVTSPPIALADASSDSDLPSRGPIEMFGDETPQPLVAQAPRRKPEARPLTLVSTSLANHLTHYWDRVGVQPTKLLPSDEIAKRLADQFHLKVDPAATGNSEAMRSLLARPRNAMSLAGPILAAISSRPDTSLTRPVDQQMITQVAKKLREGKGFDRLVASWFIEQDKSEDKPADESESAMVASVGNLLRPLSQHEAVVSTAALTLGTDMRCVRCHDLPSSSGDATGTQHEYWQFAANLSPWLSEKTNAPSGWFYDTLDGRRRLAEVDARSSVPQQLVGSRQLAEGLVGAMWRMVHGRPLTSSPYDLTGSADDSDLQQLRDDLTDDLIASDFDLLRTISLIMTDSIVGRSTPEAMTPKGLLTASADQWIQAVTAVESFAAAPPASMPSSRVDRLNLVLNELPRTGSVDSSSALLAQPLGSDQLGLDALQGPQRFLPAEMPKPSPATLAGLPLRATIVMPAWMGKLPDFESRLVHIANLAGLSEVPDDVNMLAQQMRDAGLEEALILQRIWWIMRPQD